MSRRFEDLIDQWLDDEMPAEGKKELHDSLLDPENMRAFVEANARDALLREVVSEICQTEVVNHAMAEDKIVSLPGRSWPKWQAIAAAVAISFSVMFMVFRDGGVHGEVLAADGAPHEVGSSISIDRFLLEQGSVELALASGVRIQFFAPVEAEFESDMKMRLVAGRMSADVGPRGKGFTVVTHAGEVIDLGTRFGVEADRDGEARVAVFSGVVQVKPKNPALNQEPVTLTEGQAARFSVLAGLRRWDQVALAARAGRLASREYSGVVSRIRDNRGDEELHPFYGIVRGGMRPGALVYTDKPNPRWSGDGSLPESLRGADLIRTYNQFRHKKRFALTLTLREPAIVYVLTEAMQRPPAWLTNEFRKVDGQISAGPFQQGIVERPGAKPDKDGLPWFAFNIWQKSADAGDLILGPAKADENSLSPLMYGLAVQAARKTD